mgnify:FL=1
MSRAAPDYRIRTTRRLCWRRQEQRGKGVELQDKIIVVTGGASGIGREMCHRFTREGAKKVIVADLNGDGAKAVADDIGSVGHAVDVSCEQDLINLIEDTEAHFGPIDLFCSNAGIAIGVDIFEPDELWHKIWQVNTMSHIWAARHLVPRMIARGGGYLLNTASAAGLLSQIGSAPYAVTKHAAVALAELLSITYGDQGIKVSVLCPQAVRTAMTADGPGVAGVDGMIEPQEAVNAVVETLREERFLVLPHPEVAEYMQRKTADYDRWLKGMRRLQGLYTASQ